MITLCTTKQNPYKILLSEYIEYRLCRFVLNNTYTNIDVLASKVAGFLIHLHYSSKEYSPIPRAFLEQNGYEYLTSASLYDRIGEETHTSLYFLQHLKIISIIPSQDGRCREYKLLPRGEAIVAGLALFYRGRYPNKELELKPGDLTHEYKDYAYYEEVEQFYPDRELIDNFLSYMDKTTINLTTYVKGFTAQYPIVNTTQEEYEGILKRSIITLRENFIEDFEVLRQFDRDLHLITSGINVRKMVSRQNVITYENVWRLSYTGRLFQRHGLQGLTRKSKTIVHKDHINYDISSSQLTLLIQLLEEIYSRYGKDFTEDELKAYGNIKELREYIGDPSKKYVISKECGVSPDDWKKCLYSLVYGANLNNLNYNTTIGFIIRHNMIINPKFDKDKFIFYLSPLVNVLGLWYNYLNKWVTEYEMPFIKQLKFRNEYKENPQDFFYNGINFIRKTDLLKKEPSKTTSYILQGIESTFIIVIMTLLPEVAISYEFDGLVVDREIPLEVIEEAKRISGFTSAKLIVKPFE